MIQPLLRLALEPVADRHRKLRLFTSLAIAWAALAGIAFAAWWYGRSGLLTAPLLACLAGLAYWGLRKRALSWEPDWQSIARVVEQRHPQLHALLITAVEQRPDPHTGKLHFLQERVIQNAVAESRRHHWMNAVPAWRLWGVALLQTALLVSFLCALLAMQRTAFSDFGRPAPVAVKEAVTVTPGDVELERGSGLVVLARFDRNVPGTATLVVVPSDGKEQRLPLSKNMDDPVFGGGPPEVQADMLYRVEYSDRQTRDFKVHVFEHPKLERADAVLQYPEYTRLPERKIQDTRRVSAVQGTHLDLTLALNKPVRSAGLKAKDGTTIPLAVDPSSAIVRLEKHEIQQSGTYTLELEDEEGRASKVPAQIAIEALPNRRPDLKLITPRGDQRVSPLQEVAFQEEAWDDFGLLSYGLSYTLAGGETKEVVLGRDAAPDQKVQGSHLLKLEELDVEPDQLLSWFAWAEDIGPDGKPRRTASDMFFAEVRPFEEIYRADQGNEGDQQQQQGGGGGAGGEAMKLAQVQKQIITATWNLKRSEEGVGGATPSENYRKDEPVVRDSQKEALKQAQKLGAKADQAKTQALVERIVGPMTAAAEQLERGAESVAPLTNALQSEQAAYNALLKLAAHEFNVTRSKSSESGGGEQSGGRQQQLDQLELKDEKKRYETKREATPQQNEEQREQLAVINRLKELAQRQQDINERLKEMQTALQEAKTEQQKEELKRQLKRLREEEQQMLADMDEARQRMEQSANPSQFADERRQMDQTRDEAQKAAEAMERQDPSQALAGGSRTEKNLQQMRDDFRKKTSGQFNDRMREMRSEARDLAENQEALAEKLDKEAQPATPTRRSLDGSSPREELATAFNKQQEQLKGLQERMQKTSEEAEAAEPLLSRELYDTLRKNTQAGTQETLERAGQLARRGFGPQAKQFEDKARREIEELKNGVEKAAENVLGNEAEALKLARAELDSLSQQLQRELAQADPNGEKQAGAGQQAGKQPGKGNQQQGEGQKPGTDDEKNTANASNNGKQGGNKPGQNNDPSQNPGEGSEGQQTAQKESQKPGQGSQGKGQGQSKGGQTAQNNSSQSPGQGGSPGQGDQPGQPGEGNQPGEGQPGQDGKPGQPGNTPGTAQQGRSGKGSSGGGQGGDANSEPSQQQQPQGGSALRELAASGSRQRGGIRSGGGDNGGDQGGGAETAEGPIRGEGFVQWSDRLRNVEEMIDDPKLRNEVAAVRETARGIRAEFKRHSTEPKWDIVRSKIGAPLADLRNRVTEELAKRESRESLVPIDRDPVPTKYAEGVRRYYEELGRSH